MQMLDDSDVGVVGLLGVIWQNSRAQDCRISAFARTNQCAALFSAACCRMHEEDAKLDRTLRQ